MIAFIWSVSRYRFAGGCESLPFPPPAPSSWSPPSSNDARGSSAASPIMGVAWVSLAVGEPSCEFATPLEPSPLASSLVRSCLRSARGVGWLVSEG